jgi:hypothetical protein
MPQDDRDDENNVDVQNDQDNKDGRLTTRPLAINKDQANPGKIMVTFPGRRILTPTKNTPETPDGGSMSTYNEKAKLRNDKTGEDQQDNFEEQAPRVPLSTYPADIFAQSSETSSEYSEEDVGDIFRGISQKKAGKKNKVRKKEKLNPAPVGVPFRTEMEIIKEATAVERLFMESKRRATIELKPIMDHLLNQPVESNKAPGQTIDKKTIMVQDKIAVNLMRRFSTENSIGFGIDEFPYVKFANWLLTFSARVKMSTVKKYKNCVVDYLSSMPDEEVSQAINIILHSGADAEDDDDEAKDMSHLTGSERRTHIIKEFPIDDFVFVIRHLRNISKSKNANDLAALLESSMMTGLRPTEWQGATIMSRQDKTAPYNRRVWLFVANAKATNGRGNGLIRSIEISEYQDSAINAINSTINLAKELAIQGRFEIDFREKFIKMMYRTTCTLWDSDPEKGYSLYSCRHQASANWKSMMTAVEVAALSGHAIPLTSQRWYGQKKTAWPKKLLKSTARPSPDEVKMVIERMQMVRRHEAMVNNMQDHPIDNEDLLMLK